MIFFVIIFITVVIWDTEISIICNYMSFISAAIPILSWGNCVI